MGRPTLSLLDEIHQQQPFDSIAQEATLALLRTTDLVRRRLLGVIEPHGITLQQYNVLRILRGAGTDGLQTLEIASRMIEQTPGITRLLDRLENKRWVRRERPAGDRRCVICRITDSGLKLLSRLDEPVKSNDALATGCLANEQLEQLVDLLARVRAAHAAHEIDRCRNHASTTGKEELPGGTIR